MTGTTVNSESFDKNVIAGIVGNAMAGSRKVAGTTQDFGSVFNQASQKTDQPKETYKATESTKQPEQKTADAPQAVAEKPDRSDELQDAEQSGEIVEDNADAKAVTEEQPVEAAEEPVETEERSVETEELIDEETTERIVDVLQQIIGQLEELLGVTDEEIADSMSNIGMHPVDLLDSANMAQLMTAITGENSVISLVADEDLYQALQDITELVDTQAGSLLEETGLTDAQLDDLLESLQGAQELWQPETETETPVMVSEIAEEASDGAEIIPFVVSDETVTQSAGAEAVQEEPADTQEDSALDKLQMQRLSESQQADSEADSVKLQPQKTEHKEHESGAKEFGQSQNMAQDFKGNLNEVANTAAETVEKFTSESTENILRQLADIVKIVKNENLTQMEMQLHPASLGTVNVSLTTKGGAVTAEFTTQNEIVKAAIEAQASQLQAKLEEQGVKIEAIEVSVESHQMEKNLDEGNRDQQSRQEQEQKTGRVQGMRRGSINFNAFADGEELTGEMQGADDATRIAMELMAANGNRMDLLA